jgi:hypothetical protein
MGKRHQATRRRTYGRRQHELREREVRQPEREGWDDIGTALGWEDAVETFARPLDLGAARLRFALGD